MKPLRAALVASLILSLSALFSPLRSPLPARAAASQPHFKAARCPFKPGKGIVQGRTLRCGYLIVPENRAKPNGRKVRLALAIFKSQALSTAPDPIIFLQGGPGGSIVQQLGSIVTADVLPGLLGGHDLILVDQRGTGYSRPSLDCPELTRLKYATLDQNLSMKRQTALETGATRRCHARLLGQGIDLNAYTSRADAADIADIGPALGYKSVDLYGVSYGTRLALTIMRDYPKGVRSIVLDSVDAVQDNLFSGPLRSLHRVLGVLFAGCAANARCNRAYPHLDHIFYNAVKKLNTHPITFTATNSTTKKRYKILLNGDGLTNLVFDTFYDTPRIKDLPVLIWQLSRGKTALAAAIYGELEFDDSVNLGVYYSVECGEDAPYVKPGEVVAAGKLLAPPIRTAQVQNSQGNLAQCKVWNVRGVAPSQKTPVHSAIPTLVLSGEYDPITPPANGRITARALRHSYFFEFPGLGHGVFLSDHCPFSMTQAFFDDPTQRPDSSCIKSMKEPQFTVAR